MPRPNAGMPTARTQRSSIRSSIRSSASPARSPAPPSGSGADCPGSTARGRGSAENTGDGAAIIDSGAGMDNINYLAALVAAVSSFVIGGVWYSPILFARAWQREAGLTDDQLRTQLGKTFTGAFVLSL